MFCFFIIFKNIFFLVLQYSFLVFFFLFLNKPYIYKQGNICTSLYRKKSIVQTVDIFLIIIPLIKYKLICISFFL